MGLRRWFYLAIAFLCASLSAYSQQNDNPQENARRRADTIGRLTCPGGFPTDLTVINCSYTLRQRGNDFFTGSVSDQAILGAVVFGAGAQILKSPGEWGRTWDGYGRRVGVRYNQAVAKGAAEFLIGSAFSEDPRHISYRSDPHFVNLQRDRLNRIASGKSVDRDPYDQTAPGAWKRIGHAFYDSVSVRRSRPDGNGSRWPAVSRFVGAFASGYGGYAWYKRPENTFANAGLRAAQSFGTDVAASFYTEFSPDISKLLGAVLKRGRQQKP